MSFSFILEMSDVYYLKFFIQPILLTFAVSLALFFYFYVSLNGSRWNYLKLYVALHFLTLLRACGCPGWELQYCVTRSCTFCVTLETKLNWL